MEIHAPGDDRQSGRRARGWSWGKWALLAAGCFVAAALVLPVFNRTCVKGEATKSLALAKQIGLACKLYASDHEGRFPKTLEELVPTYVQDARLFICPLDGGKSLMGYDYFGGADDDDPRRVLLQSKAATRDGKRVVIYANAAGELARQR